MLQVVEFLIYFRTSDVFTRSPNGRPGTVAPEKTHAAIQMEADACSVCLSTITDEIAAAGRVDIRKKVQHPWLQNVSVCSCCADSLARSIIF
jgi:hypothetical protein